MLKVNSEIQVTIQKNTPTIIGIGVSSEFDTPKSVTVSTSCGCTKTLPSFVIEPYDHKTIDFTVEKAQSGLVQISFVTNGKIFSTNLVVNVN